MNKTDDFFEIKNTSFEIKGKPIPCRNPKCNSDRFNIDVFGVENTLNQWPTLTQVCYCVKCRTTLFEPDNDEVRKAIKKVSMGINWSD